MVQQQKIVVGVDEAGRGPLAGPVIACAITSPANFKLQISNVKQITNDKCLPRAKAKLSVRGQMPKKLIKDSKQLTAKQREQVYLALKNNPQVAWAIGRAGERLIDKINIFEASKLAMKRAVLNLEKKLTDSNRGGSPVTLQGNLPCKVLLLVDGNFKISLNYLPQLNLPVEQQAIVKGDEKIPLISLASIIAKVSRDKIMRNYHKKYPQYGFEQHKGYPTAQHKIQLANFGPSDIHRQTFKPVAQLLQK